MIEDTQESIAPRIVFKRRELQKKLLNSYVQNYADAGGKGH